MASYALDCLQVRHRRSYDEGYRVGYEVGLEKGALLYESLDMRSLESAKPKQDKYLFDTWSLPIDEALRNRMIRDVQERLPLHKQPTEDQWLMIFSTTPSTCVVAGAGSGKSTTLVLRILLLHHYLGFELSSMTVVTFTAMSRFDFTEKLVETFRLWGVELSPEKVKKQLVRTFHSKILDFARALPGLDRVCPFEFFKEESSQSDLVDDDDENNEAVGFSTRLNEAQFRLLNRAYDHLYVANDRFKALIQILYERSLVLAQMDATSDMAREQLGRLSALSESDSACMDAVELAWRQEGAWPIEGIEPIRRTIIVQGKPFQVHGTFSALGVPVVLGADKYPGKEFWRPDVKARLTTEMARKRMLLSAYCDRPIIWLSDPEPASAYLEWRASRSARAPGFDYKVAGELSAVNLLECFYGVASFIENLALDVRETIAGMAFASGNADSEFFEALSLFWPAFEKTLAQEEPTVMTFNRIFSLFGEHASRNLQTIPDGILRSMSHLMIDEFQDISPQIVSWVRASLSEIRRRGAKLHVGRKAQHSSLLCVGDDWQSIYGWRGSAPKFFLEFPNEFKAHQNTSVMLRENFRSHQLVVDAAEHIVRTVATINGKKARSAGPASADPAPVEIHDRDDRAIIDRITEAVEAGNSVMVLYRRKRDAALIRKGLKTLLASEARKQKSSRRLRLLTYHSSKGLEADVAVMIGDCTYTANSPYKNAAYLAARLGQEGQVHPYDIAQAEEALRLAYVAITRAAKRCYWYLDSVSTTDESAASTRISAHNSCFVDKRSASRPSVSGQRKLGGRLAK